MTFDLSFSVTTTVHLIRICQSLVESTAPLFISFKDRTNKVGPNECIVCNELVMI